MLALVDTETDSARQRMLHSVVEYLTSNRVNVNGRRGAKWRA
jgi:hypothetical protein